MNTQSPPHISSAGLAVLAAVAVLAAAATPTASASNELTDANERNRYTHDWCEGTRPDGSPNPCGVIVYAVAGAYSVPNVRLKSLDDQPDLSANPMCADVYVKFEDTLNINQYDTFVVPAMCAYELQINIAAGPKKDRNLFLTPACQIVTKTDGTTMSSDWHMSVDYVKGHKPAGAPDKPVDPHGHKCGSLGDSGAK